MGVFLILSHFLYDFLLPRGFFHKSSEKSEKWDSSQLSYLKRFYSFDIKRGKAKM